MKVKPASGTAGDEDTKQSRLSVQFLSHQSKCFSCTELCMMEDGIATKIDLYTAMPAAGQASTYDALSFKRLGYLSLDSNERSQFQARELKSVYVDVASSAGFPGTKTVEGDRSDRLSAEAFKARCKDDGGKKEDDKDDDGKKEDDKHGDRDRKDDDKDGRHGHHRRHSKSGGAGSLCIFTTDNLELMVITIAMPDLAMGPPPPNPALARGPANEWLPATASIFASATTAIGAGRVWTAMGYPSIFYAICVRCNCYVRRYDAQTLERIRSLSNAKAARAVDAEDYEEAKRCKEMLARLRQTGLLLRELEDRKKAAVQNEDYDAAKALKSEIDRLRSAIERPEVPVPEAPISPAIIVRLVADTSHKWFRCSDASTTFSWKALTLSESAGFPVGGGLQPGRSPETRGEFDTATNKKLQPTLRPCLRRAGREWRNGRLGEMPRATAATFPEAPKELPPEQPPLSERGFDAADHPLSGVPNVEDLSQPEPLNSNFQKEAEPLIQLFGEYLTNCVYSKAWSLRDAALQKLTLDLQNGEHQPPGWSTDQSRLLAGYVIVLKRMVPDKNVQVFLAAAALLHTVCQELLGRSGPRRAEAGPGTEKLKEDPCTWDVFSDAVGGVGEWLVETFGTDFLRGGSGVLEISAGKGELACSLRNRYGVPVTAVEPRSLDLRKCSAKTIFGRAVGGQPVHPVPPTGGRGLTPSLTMNGNRAPDSWRRPSASCSWLWALASLLLSLSQQRFRQASPIWSGASDASAPDHGLAYVGGWLSNLEPPARQDVFWFHYQVKEHVHPWAFDKGCPKQRIAALEMFGTLLLAHFLIEKAPAYVPNLGIPLVSDNQGIGYPLLKN
ncbi:Centrosomal protein of 104 kDa [Symbiodinium microadriaticum]|uniref:Centrosomal protein of 104 kDa n=1 Tax=Symbiodinium microadriaticum TaxID=2951 RepID=A0A1Q9DQR6_SYMMI|nr:Centrosomal protein of 104 kDa [Symbiodinium microadriaticum]